MALTPELLLPWTSSEQDNTRFRKILRNSLFVLALLAIGIPFISVPEINRQPREVLPPQLATINLEKKQLPKPIVIKSEQMPVEIAKHKPVEKKRVIPKPTVIPEPKFVEIPIKAKPEPKRVDLIKKAKDTAAVAGLLVFQDDLAEMRDSIDVEVLSKQSLSRGEATATKLERSIISSKAKSISGGIQVAALSRNTDGTALSGKQDTKVASSIAGLANIQSSLSASVSVGGRSDQSVRREMDKNKGAIFAIYHRALRRDPALQGKYVFEMLIDPDGSISEIKLLSSELANAGLERKILSRVRLIRFDVEKVIKTRVNYSFDFLPY